MLTGSEELYGFLLRPKHNWSFHLLKSIVYCPLLVFKGIYHRWIIIIISIIVIIVMISIIVIIVIISISMIIIIWTGGLRKWKVPSRFGEMLDSPSRGARLVQAYGFRCRCVACAGKLSPLPSWHAFFWVNNDLTRPDPKWWFMWGIAHHLISGW